MDQSQTQRYVSRFEPLLYVPAFTQKDFHYIVHTGLPTQGTSTEDLGKYSQKYTTPLSNKFNLYTRGKAQLQSPLHLEGWALSQKIITSHQRDKAQSQHSNNHLYTQRDTKTTKHNLHNHFYTRGIPTNTRKVTTLGGLNKPQTNFLTKNKILQIGQI